MLVTQAQVRGRISLLTDSGNDPPLASVDLDVLLEMAKRVDRYGSPPDDYTEWVAGATHSVGAMVVPIARFTYPPELIQRNGYYYACTTGGTSGATQPAWPVVLGAQITDGTVVWLCAGVARWYPTYDVNYAVAQGWLLKASRLAGHYNFMTGGKMLSRQQFYDHCMKQYKVYSSKSGIKALRMGRWQQMGDALTGLVHGSVETSVDG